MRPVLGEAQVHPAVRDAVAGWHSSTVQAVQALAAQHRVLVVGMALNPYPRRARRLLQAAGVTHHYVEYGSYFSQWQQRLALKMWSGWPTLPMVFVGGVLVGGADDVQRLLDSGELQRLLE